MGKEELRSGWNQPRVRKPKATSSPGRRILAPYAMQATVFSRTIDMDLGGSVTCFKATLNRVENIPWNTEDLFLTKVTRPIYKNKTK